ncbi:MAG: 4-(cytidine 5'-diphospho)-2-C-methyl-D-erythritol kinase [Dehalococcoidia bacterium]
MRVLAPAKINWTLEVLGRREDGYHELRSILQTIGLCDTVTIKPAGEVKVAFSGRVEGLDGLGGNLVQAAYRVATGVFNRADAVSIEVIKRIPAAGGLGGGSSDAAAVLRGLNALWGPVDRWRLREAAAELGSDVPFFIECGTVMVAGRGEELTILPEAPRKHLVLALARDETPAKTARMFAALQPQDFLDGAQSLALMLRFNHRLEYDDGHLCNSFERAGYTQLPHLAKTRDLLHGCGKEAHLAGAGPTLFAIFDEEGDAETCASGLRVQGVDAISVRTLASIEALRVEAIQADG